MRRYDEGESVNVPDAPATPGGGAMMMTVMMFAAAACALAGVLYFKIQDPYAMPPAGRMDPELKGEILQRPAPGEEETPPGTAVATPMSQRRFRLVHEVPVASFTGLPIGLYAVGDALVTPGITKANRTVMPMDAVVWRGGKQTSIRNVAALCEPEPLTDDLFLQPTIGPDRKEWGVSTFSFAKGGITESKWISKHPDSEYVHQAHLVRADDNTLYAMIGVFGGFEPENECFFELVRYDEAAKKWSEPRRVLEDVVAFDDLITDCVAYGNHLLFAGIRKSQEPCLVEITGDNEFDRPLPEGKIRSMKLFVQDDGVAAYFIRKEEGNTLSFLFSRADASWKWSEPVAVFENLAPKDPATQFPTTNIAVGRHFLVSAVDCFGNWQNGEFAARIKLSDDGGLSWFEAPMPEAWENDPPLLVSGVAAGDSIFLSTQHGKWPNQIRLQLWSFDK